jgi:hypothetical protein
MYRRACLKAGVPTWAMKLSCFQSNYLIFGCELMQQGV